MTRPKGRTPRSIKLSCDRLWPKIVKTRAGGCCERCGVSPEVSRAFHAHHIYKRNNYRLRWEPRNGMALCAACHRWAEEHPLEFTDWFREVRKEDAQWLMEENRGGLIKRTTQDYLDLEAQLRDKLEAVESECFPPDEFKGLSSPDYSWDD